jgi:chemotaxis protein methyltransferase CheR
MKEFVPKNIFAQPELILYEEDFLFFKGEIKKRSGINLTDMKANLVQSRLRVRVLQLGLEDFQSYRLYLSKNESEWQTFINQLTTNKTDWFREENHFRFLTETFLPDWKKLGKKNLKVWCAASSTGEEPYTLALVLSDFFKQSDINFSILATDIDTSVLEFAANGIYSLAEYKKIPEKYRFGFDLGKGEIKDWVRVNKNIKSRVQFQQFNLLSKDYGKREEYDLIFCRNVLIYFDKETVKHVAEQCFNSGSTESALFISHSESLQNISTPWTYKRPSIYRKGKLLNW